MQPLEIYNALWQSMIDFSSTVQDFQACSPYNWIADSGYDIEKQVMFENGWPCTWKILSSKLK